MTSQSIHEPNCKILVVDDTLDNVNLLSKMLTDSGYKVRKALNGQMALMGVQASPPDLILLDINMPDINGYQVCEQLKAEEKTRDIPVIFLSALDDVLDKVKAFKVGAVDYITKPFQFEEVLARVENHLKICRLQQELEEQNALLRLEREKSERLLLNILPKAIAAQLKESSSAIAEHFDEASILFADIVGFTPLSAKMSASELVALLNQIFSQFDELATQHGLEKIKTIGDSYMVVGGVPIPQNNHAEAIAQMALDMQQAIGQFQTQTGEPFQIRCGIATGPVVAGVIGTTKFIYDLWGDAVNIASRMESQGLPGQIQVTAETYQRLKSNYLFTERGTVAIRGKGEMLTYWLTGKGS
jgi:class 3 adenylate cyclase